MPATPRLRPAVRAVVTDPARRILLVHFDFPWDDTLPGGLWACPGGGIDPGESHPEALVRELREELGLEFDDPGTAMWSREQVFVMERWDGQHDTFYWLQVEPFDPRPGLSEEDLRSENVDMMRWWSYDELVHAQRKGREVPATSGLTMRRQAASRPTLGRTPWQAPRAAPRLHRESPRRRVR
jgi:8-oxo-dGTP pyrophosphatase MutT (NUDIX family)